MQPQQHEDPVSEAKQQLLQGLATLSTVLEAGARWAAVNIQNEAAERERQAQREQAADAARQQAEKLQAKVHAERQKMAASIDDDSLSRATFTEAAQVWRTAVVHAAQGDPVAQKVAGLAAERMRELRPDLMDAYDRYRAENRPVNEAMRAAAYEVWETCARTNRWASPARSQGGPQPAPDGPAALPAGAVKPVGKSPAALPAGGWKPLNDIDAAVRWEAGRLMEHVSAEALDTLQRRFRAAGNLPAGEAMDLLKQYAAEQLVAATMSPAAVRAMTDRLDALAAQERARGVAAAGTADNPWTRADEHTAGQAASVLHDDTADHDAAAAAAMRGGSRPAWANAFPALVVGKLPADVAVKQPAQARTAVTTRGRTR
jgi:hypothetical protein